MGKVSWFLFCCLGGAVLSVDAESGVSYVTENGNETVSFPSDTVDKTESESRDRAEFPECEVLNSHSRKRYVRKPSEFPDLPPVEGEIMVTYELVSDPQFVDEPERPLESGTVSDSEVPVVETDTQGRQVGEADYDLLIASSDHDTDSIRARAQQEGRRYEPPIIPDLPDLEEGGLAFVLVESDGGDENPEAMVMLERLHKLYWSEGDRMKTAYEKRVKAREERKADLLANHPKPEDVRIRFWKRDTSSGRANSTEER
jgi:hypothetical protein